LRCAQREREEIMGIVDSKNSGRSRRSSKWEYLAGGALVAAAVFGATPKPAHGDIIFTRTGGTTTDPNSPNAVSWFNAGYWSNAGATGTIAESQVGAPSAINIDANNSSMPSVGVIFDPADDNNTPGGHNTNYTANLANIQGTFYISSIEGTVAAPNKLTIDSGTIIAGSATIGRDGPGILALNGGTFITETGALKIQGSNKSTLLGGGTFEYHGGNLETELGVQLGSGACTSGVGKTSAGVGTFVVYNDGPDGAILSQNGFQFATNTNSVGTVGIVEFHYDSQFSFDYGGLYNPNWIITHPINGHSYTDKNLVNGQYYAYGSTRPIQTNWNDGNAESGQGVLHLNNNTNASSRLNLVLDTSPGSIVPVSYPGAIYQNLGLFDETLILGSGTYPKAFYSVDGSRVFTQGATISAGYAGLTYSWTISYSGQINFSDTATSAYDSTGIQATGGDDVVLLGITPLAGLVPVPEPSSLALLGGTGSLILARRRGRKTKS
jgi:hypothetical protein